MKARVIVAAAATLLLSIGSASANVVSGNLWRVPEATSQNAIPANVPATAPDVTFDVNSPLNFSGNGATIGAWLASGGAFNLVENTAGTLSSLMDNGTQGTLLQFTGVVSVTNGQTFTVTHDDGLTLIIGGIDLGFNPGPTAPVVSVAMYTGPTGTFPFQLVYGECCGGPAVLQVALPFSNTAIPEPGTIALLGLVALGAAGFARRRVC
ncbi:MAG TPA: PEP-CTERM sorting domain-containing protein [Burkholderiales bacterium]|nr:PEP-CTERM sorting domain-containing protein [Burkholderiales bacterium]